MLYFIFVLLWNSILTAQFCLSGHAGKPFSFLNGLVSTFYMLPHVVGTAKPYQSGKQQRKATPPHPAQAKYWWGKKVERNLLLLFKWCSHSLLPHGAQEGVETYFCPPPRLPHSPPPLWRVAPVFPWAKRLWFLADFMSATQVRGKSLLPPPTLLSHVRLGQDFARCCPIFAMCLSHKVKEETEMGHKP